MMEMDLEDYIEEVKFQMVDHYDDVLDKETILGWEEKAREWVKQDKGKSPCIRCRSEEEIYVRVKNEEVCETAAAKFYQAVVNKSLDSYWKKFKLV
jgi:hypothetical protein